MRAYLPISHSGLVEFLTTESFAVESVFAATPAFINENLDCDEEEVEYLLSLQAAQVSLDIRTSPSAPGIVLAVDLEGGQCGENLENSIRLKKPIAFAQVQCALLVHNGDEDLIWFATQEIAQELVNWR